MANQRVVRCRLRRTGEDGPGSARYIPHEIFGLWEYLMTSRHGFEVIEPRTSLWMDLEDSPDAPYDGNQYDRVTEVTAFVYSDRDGMFVRVCRYFPSPDCPELKPIFLKHYPDGEQIQSKVVERSGIWVHRPEGAEVLQPA